MGYWEVNVNAWETWPSDFGLCDLGTMNSQCTPQILITHQIGGWMDHQTHPFLYLIFCGPITILRTIIKNIYTECGENVIVDTLLPQNLSSTPFIFHPFLKIYNFIFIIFCSWPRNPLTHYHSHFIIKLIYKNRSTCHQLFQSTFYYIS